MGVRTHLHPQRKQCAKKRLFLGLNMNKEAVDVPFSSGKMPLMCGQKFERVPLTKSVNTCSKVNTEVNTDFKKKSYIKKKPTPICLIKKKEPRKCRYEKYMNSFTHFFINFIVSLPAAMIKQNITRETLISCINIHIRIIYIYTYMLIHCCHFPKHLRRMNALRLL